MSTLRYVLVAFTAVICVVIGLFLGRLRGGWLGGASGPTWNTATLLRQVQSLSQLVTVKYVMEKVIVVEDAKWYGDNRVLLLAHGSVNAGIDLAELQPGDLEIHDKKITIRLPPAHITDAYLDDQATKVIEWTTGLLRTFDKTMGQTARQRAVDDIRRAARDEGILKEADQRGREQIKGLFNQLGFDVEFKNP